MNKNITIDIFSWFIIIDKNRNKKEGK